MHRAERSDRLAAGLAEVLGQRPSDPFAAEVVAVPARGVERWLTQRLSHVLGTGTGTGTDSGGGKGSGTDGSVGEGGTDGVCANVRFTSPDALVAEAVATASGAAPEEDPWQPGRIVWPLLELVAECAVEPWCTPLHAHVGGSSDSPGRPYTAAAHLAKLYESYGAQRPAMLRAWAGGDDLDGAGAALESDLRWQAELWRRLRARIGTPSPAERLEPACAALQRRPEIVALPERLSLFGPTRLSRDQLAVLAALAERREVHLWLPHPSPALWERIRPHAADASGTRRRSDPTVILGRHPLLASLGRDARELQLMLASGGAELTDRHLPEAGGPAQPSPAAPANLLGRLQAELRADQPPTEPPGPRPLLDPEDRSLAVHACHGPARQVEVLREVLLGLLAVDPTLEPRDVLVMCPDIEAFAPLISAAFGSAEEPEENQHPAQRLRVRLADRSLRQTNPLLAFLAQMLDLAGGRVAASAVLDLAATPPVRRRFGFDDDDLDRIRTWVTESGIRWGLDAAHRAPFRLNHIPQNTWESGLDRILLGAAAGDDQRWLGLALPLDDVDSGDIDLAGRLAELVERLGTALDQLTGEHSLTWWLEALDSALDALTAVGDRDGWQLAQARRELAEVGAEAGERAAQVRLALPDVRALLAGRLRGRPTRANFRTGSLTMCSMVPMRSVPHRVICLLGLDDGVFPRNATADGDDALARDPLVGERDRRSEERQLLLDAVLAAREHLVILYTGADDRTNARRQPAVPLGEILDAVDDSVRTADGSPARAQVVVSHPLQPFDARNFTAGALGARGPFSFDRPALAGATASAGTRQLPAPFLRAPLPPAPADGVVELADLISFLEHPARGFLRQRLGVTVAGEDEEVGDALAAELAPLQRWAVGDRLLTARLTGADAQRCRQVEWRRGSVPPGRLGATLLDSLLGEVEPLVSAAATDRVAEPQTVTVHLTVPAITPAGAGVTLTGTVPGVHDRTLVRVVYSWLAPKHRLRAWVQLLALAAAYPQQKGRAVTLGRGRRAAARATLVPPEAATARRILADLLDLYAAGLREPLPLTPKASHAYATARNGGEPPDAALAAAAEAWRSSRGSGEAEDRCHQLVWGVAAEFARLLDQPIPPAETGAGWPQELTRFGVLARRLWDPLLAAETRDVP